MYCRVANHAVSDERSRNEEWRTGFLVHQGRMMMVVVMMMMMMMLCWWWNQHKPPPCCCRLLSTWLWISLSPPYLILDKNDWRQKAEKFLQPGCPSCLSVSSIRAVMANRNSDPSSRRKYLLYHQSLCAKTFCTVCYTKTYINLKTFVIHIT